jgi:RNA polymerase sigma-70 factor (ECF subfamily)
MAATAQTALLAAARAGDRRAFDRLVEPHRAGLQAHCYRMLGSVHDAEDAVQDTLLRAWRGLPRFEGRSSLRSWLVTIATNASLRVAERRSRRGLPMDFRPAAESGSEPGPPLAESVWIEPYPGRGPAPEPTPEARYDERESLELAFVAAVQHLPPRQRAALLLRDVFGYSAAEVAACLETSVAAANSALQRGRATIEQRVPSRTQQATLRTLGDARVREIVEAYMRAWEREDVDAVVALLARDAILAMPPTPAWYAGLGAIAAFYRELVAEGYRWRHLATFANAQPAVGCYLWDERSGRFAATVVDVLAFRGERIAAVTAFATPEAFTGLGLPETLAPDR